jgi:hypothetical protein
MPAAVSKRVALLDLNKSREHRADNPDDKPSAVTKKTVAVFPHQADQNQLAFLMLLSALHKATPLVKV